MAGGTLESTLSSHNAQFFDWFALTFNESGSSRISVLDVGGGDGITGTVLRELLGPSGGRLNYTCIDSTPISTDCAAYDGTALSYPDNSYDLVIFKFVLHHAADNTVGLLQDALRVRRAYVAVTEDLKAETETQAKRNMIHDFQGVFRGRLEWEKLFELVGFSIDTSEVISTALDSDVARHFWVLN
eukprot:CAMPEP_0181184590 /NCGR_PEP_ID=MMETSP1096-20121128/9050_1 /TAXON_ID=156174 ORGANISM="Chrysochromulina ericina, Strain CCMP281" /NCGR_SAMPLE_ID=MMETSP1096 /ASSEMBLY_ACC=CAM_ASM_000453 /LENGTH=185 /DNA_ID=CAMNT_0023273367 /DNA_START=95 /DNA_END=652 /DNA_ORIENTATION=+